MLKKKFFIILFYINLIHLFCSRNGIGVHGRPHGVTLAINGRIIRRHSSPDGDESDDEDDDNKTNNGHTVGRTKRRFVVDNNLLIQIK